MSTEAIEVAEDALNTKLDALKIVEEKSAVEEKKETGTEETVKKTRKVTQHQFSAIQTFRYLLTRRGSCFGKKTSSRRNSSSLVSREPSSGTLYWGIMVSSLALMKKETSLFTR